MDRIRITLMTILAAGAVASAGCEENKDLEGASVPVTTAEQKIDRLHAPGPFPADSCSKDGPKHPMAQIPPAPVLTPGAEAMRTGDEEPAVKLARAPKHAVAAVAAQARPLSAAAQGYLAELRARQAELERLGPQEREERKAEIKQRFLGQ